MIPWSYFDWSKYISTVVGGGGGSISDHNNMQDALIGLS